jgi:hypothetical protein
MNNLLFSSTSRRNLIPLTIKILVKKLKINVKRIPYSIQINNFLTQITKEILKDQKFRLNFL